MGGTGGVARDVWSAGDPEDSGLGVARWTALHLRPGRSVRALRQRHQPERRDLRLRRQLPAVGRAARPVGQDRKSTRLNSSHGSISYAVFCLKKKKKSLFSYSISRLTGERNTI